MATFSDFICTFAGMMFPDTPDVDMYTERFVNHRTDWCDIVAMKGAREVLKGVKYPDDATRRSLYASWLKVFASSEWHESFDSLLLECVAATPSPTTPKQPLFANIYKDRDRTIDRPYPNVLTPVLILDKIPNLFVRKHELVEPLPTSPGIVDYLADLIRKSCTSQEALDEAGLIIGFCSLALAAVSAKSVGDVQDFFRVRMKRALAVAVPTFYDGDGMFCPSRRFLTELARKTHSRAGVVKPFLVVLVLGQYAYHVNAEAAPSADIRFLEEGFLKQVKFGRLEVVELLYGVQEKTGLSAAALNRILREDGSAQSVVESSRYVDEFLEGATEPMQKTRPWCRTANVCFFLTLDLLDNLDYAMRLTAVLAPDPNHQLWQRPEFGDVLPSRMKEARFWARDFRHALRIGKYSEAATSKTCQAKG
ncbi:hypothetical protein V5799_022389 [Amblyomma americanum]